jgi:cytochrome c biogenesis protein CcdA
LGALIALAALVTAVGAAYLAGSSGGALGRLVESGAAASTAFLGGLGGSLPFGYAFAAGMVAAVNPCGFALLPAYLALFVSRPDEAGGSPLRALSRALLVSATVAAAFVVLFGAAGLVLTGLAGSTGRALPWIGLAVGVLLVMAAGWLLGGGSLYSSLGERLADRLGPAARRPGLAGYAAYGVAYALVSLSCTLPIFLTVVGSALTIHGVWGGLVEFVLYGLGMASVLAVLTVAVALFRAAGLRPAFQALRHASRAGAALLLLSGAYVVFYWLSLGQLLPGLKA